MFNTVLFSDENVQIILEENQVYIKVLKKEYELSAFQDILKDLPRIKVTQFIALKAAITNAIQQLINFGEYKPIVEVSISNDQLKAYANINLTQKEFDGFNKKELIELIINGCKQQSVVYGIQIDEIINGLIPIDKFVVANGLLPIAGQDAILKLYELDEIKPQIFNDGKANFYEMNLINKVQKGDWVGERIEPTLGIPGKTITGNLIPAAPGRQHKLIYDRKTIDENINDEKTLTTLTAKQTGAVVFENGILSICNYLEVNGTVSFETGNIDFDGFVGVNDTVEDNFSIRADHDIQVMGKIGIGGVDTIESRGGNIYIRGGIAGKNKAKIICDGDFYTKFASDCTIECNGSVSIGYYAMNTNIIAKEVILESLNSKIIGGNIEAAVRVLAGEIGCKAETTTNITILGFNREQYKDEYDEISRMIIEIKDQIIFLNQKLAVFSVDNLDSKQKIIFNELETALENYNKKIKLLYEKKKRYTSYLHSKGDGEITSTKCIYPQVNLRIKNHTEFIKNFIGIPTSYYVINNELKKS